MSIKASYRFQSWSDSEVAPVKNNGQGPVPNVDQGSEIQQAVQQAVADDQVLRIIGGESKQFYGRHTEGRRLEVAGHRGIVNYETTELVVTVRSGTTILELERALAKQGQMLPFEPPRFGATATVGGMIACGLSGARRPWFGAMRDAVLGLRCINGRGQQLRFGGEVVKNVAGFDVSRLMVGALGTLGVLLEVSLKLIPRPAIEQTLVFDCTEAQALERMSAWSAKGLPLSGAVFYDQQLFIRLSGAETGVAAAVQQLGGERLADAEAWWSKIREHQHPFFSDERPLWRLSLPAAAPPVNIVGDWLHDWGGAQRWVKTALQPNIVREMAVRGGGHATLFRGGDNQGMVFHPLSEALHAVHLELKKAFDPQHLFNRGCMYPDI